MDVSVNMCRHKTHLFCPPLKSKLVFKKFISFLNKPLTSIDTASRFFIIMLFINMASCMYQSINISIFKISCTAHWNHTSLGRHLPGNLLAPPVVLGLNLALLHPLALLAEYQLDVSRLTGVLPDPSVSPVGPTTARRSAIDLRVADVELVGVQPLGLAVGDGVGEQVFDDDGGLDGPAALVAGGVALLGHGLAADAAGVSGEGHHGLVGDDVREEFGGLAGRHALDVVGDFAAVLVVDAEVRPAGFAVGDGGVGFH